MERKPGSLLQVDNFYYTTLGVQLEDFYLDRGLTFIKEYIKLIVSTDEFDTLEYQQEGLPWDDYLSTIRSYDRRRQVRHRDWTTSILELNVKRPLPLYRLDDDADSHAGLVIHSPKALQGWYSFQSFEDAMSNVQQNYRIAGNPGLLFDPFEITPGLKDAHGLSVISFYKMEEPQLPVSEDALVIKFLEVANRRPIPYEFDLAANNFRELSHEWKGNRLHIHQLPTSSFEGFFDAFGTGKHIFLKSASVESSL